jgi:hypothetical protein
MKEHRDTELGDLLRHADEAPRLAPDFDARLWKRIESETGDADDRERLRRAIVATSLVPRAASRWRWPRGRTLVVLLAGAVLFASGTVYAARLVVGGQSETANLASVATGVPDRIVFSKVRGWSGVDLFVTSPDGKGLRLLVRGWTDHPAWSPDGGRIAYVDVGHLWVMNADGSHKRELTDHTAGMPAWSPDGKQIVFVWEPGVLTNHTGDEGELFVVNADGSGLRPLSPEGVYGKDPAWAPDGRVFFDTSNLQETTDLSSADFGKAKHAGGELCSIDPQGSDLEVVTAVPTPTSFSLSRDGTWLLVWDSSADRLVRLLASGQGMEVVVVDKVSRLLSQPYPSPQRLSGHARPSRVESSWSKDGSRIVFAVVSTRHYPGGSWTWSGWSGLYVASVDGSGLRKVPNSGLALDPVWQPR